MKLLKYVFLCFMLFTILLFSAFKNTLAQSPDFFGLTTQNTLPGDPKYSFKRVKEKTTEFFKLSHKSKSQYQQDLLEKRLSELVSLVKSKNANEIPNSTQRFAYEAGKLAEGSYKDDKDQKDIIIKIFEKYKPILEKIRDNFPSNSPHWLLSQHDINTLDILTDRLK